jgi:hypothetical protein
MQDGYGKRTESVVTIGPNITREIIVTIGQYTWGESNDPENEQTMTISVGMRNVAHRNGSVRAYQGCHSEKLLTKGLNSSSC